MRNRALAVAVSGALIEVPSWLWLPRQGLVDAELQSMVRAGMLRRGLGRAYVSADQPDTVQTRAQVVSVLGQHLISGLWTAELHTALWVHIGGCPPPFFEASVARYHRRSRTLPELPLRLRQGVTGGELVATRGWETDVQMVGPVRCTIPERTMEDLLRISADDVDPLRLRLLLQQCSAEDLRARFAYRSYQAGMYQAAQRLDHLLDSVGGN
ncbi:MAG: hypothetical protein ACTHZ5_05155 [Micrococcaceae bacterium]